MICIKYFIIHDPLNNSQIINLKITMKYTTRRTLFFNDYVEIKIKICFNGFQHVLTFSKDI